jgi:spore coat protein CotH
MPTRAILPAMMAGLVAFAPAAAAQTADDLFNRNVMHEIRLTVNSRDLATLRAHTELNTYYTADLAWGSLKLRNVGIRVRGQGSRNPGKPGYRVDMQRYTTGQTFVGLSALVLDNIWQDPTLMRERLAFTMFDRLGLPAPRESYCRLFVNNVYQGLYTITEEVDARFVKGAIGETDGTLFENHWLADTYWHAEDLGSVAAYKPRLEPRTHALDADSTLYNPVVSLFKEINGPDDAVWRSRVEQYLDLPQFMAHVAVEEFVGENDGVLGYAGMNNFYLYRYQGTSRHRLFVWDKDQAFLEENRNRPVKRTDDNVLFRRAMADPELREIYFSTLEACARLAAEDDFLAHEIDLLSAVISDAARSDTRKQFSNDDWDAGVLALREFAATRPRFVLDDVARARGGS